MTIDIFRFTPPEAVVNGPEDWDALRDDDRNFLRICARVDGQMYDERMPFDEANKILDDLLGQECYVARDDTDWDEVIAVGVGYADLDKKQFWVSKLATADGHEGRGVGSDMLKYLERCAREEKMAKVALRSVLSAQSFYEGHGYEPNANGSSRDSLLTLYSKAVI